MDAVGERASDLTMAAGGVLVAGGTGALGEAVVDLLLERGWSVTASWIVAEERDRLEARFSDADRRPRLVEANLLELTAAEQAVAEVENLEAVVDLVGGFSMGERLHESDPAEFERMIELNLKPAYNLARAAIPRLLEAGGGAFVGVGARAALEPFAGAAGYVTGKAALLALIAALDAEYRDDGLRFNAVLPSVIDTPANRADMPNADQSKWVQPAEIARVIAFLISDDSKVTSGAAVPVYGRA